MRVAVVADVHANLTALEAVIADLYAVSPDLVIVGGDLVGSGSRLAHVVDRVRDLEWPSIFGNSDEMLWNKPAVDDYFESPTMHRWRPIIDRAIIATSSALGPDRIAWLRALPREWHDGDNLAVVHASPTTTWRAPGSSASDAELGDTYESLHSQRVMYGHIHHPFVRGVRGFTVANCGSVGLPYDGDCRAAYAVADDHTITIRRVEYDVEAEVAALSAHHCPDANWIAAMLRAGAPVAPILS